LDENEHKSEEREKKDFNTQRKSNTKRIKGPHTTRLITTEEFRLKEFVVEQGV
jgi:hypothetical protein